jgi:hypothetical protein
MDRSLDTPSLSAEAYGKGEKCALLRTKLFSISDPHWITQLSSEMIVVVVASYVCVFFFAV